MVSTSWANGTMPAHFGKRIVSALGKRSSSGRRRLRILDSRPPSALSAIAHFRFLSSFSAIRALTTFFTRAADRGLSMGN